MKTLGSTTTYDGTEHSHLRGLAGGANGSLYVLTRRALGPAQNARTTMSTTTKRTQPTTTLSQGESRNGTPEPQIALRFPKGTSYRVVKAALHKLVAEIELATPASVRGPRNLELAQKTALLDRLRRRTLDDGMSLSHCTERSVQRSARIRRASRHRGVPMKTAIVVFSDPKSGSDEALGRLFNALAAAYDIKQKNEHVEIVFQGAGTRWAGVLTQKDHPAHALYKAVEDRVVGVSSGCADVFGARADAEKNGFSLITTNQVPGTSGLPSLAEYAKDGYSVLTF